MEKVIAHIINMLISEGVISEEDKDLYSYSIFCLYIDLAPFLLGIPLGLLFSLSPISILLFLLPFVGLRKFCGGYHTKTLRNCIIVSSALLSFFYLIIRLAEIHKPVQITCFIVLLVILFTLFIFSPVDSENRNLTEREVKKFQIIARIQIIILFILIILFMLLKKQDFSLPIMMGTIFTGSLQIPVIILKCINNHRKHT